MTPRQPPIVRSLRFGSLGITVELPGSLRRVRRTRNGTVPARDLPRIELSDDKPDLHVTRQSPERWLDRWKAPPDFWERQAAAPAGEPAAPSLADEVAELSWYHTIELPGSVVTPGIFDHRSLVADYGLPASLAGKRALDVATFDGFWAFELERRGASVTGIDLPSLAGLDWPAGMGELFVRAELDRDPSHGFRLAHRALGSSVELVKSSVYELEPDRLGQFDFVHVGDLLLHLRDPVRALAAIRSVTADGGTVHISDAFEPSLAGRRALQYEGGWDFCTWWIPSLDALAQMVLDAGFREVRLHRTFRANTDEGPGWWRAILIGSP